jgi:RNA polymerase sigma factor (sigma-70 family)
MQELFIKLSCMRGLDSIANMRAYAQRAAINLAFDWRRKNRQDTVKIAGFDKPVLKEVSPLKKLIQDEELEEVLDVIGRLKGAGRRVIVMRYIQQQSYDLIAEQLGNTPHRAGALCHKALSQIRVLLESNHYKVSRKRSDNV